MSKPDDDDEAPQPEVYFSITIGPSTKSRVITVAIMPTQHTLEAPDDHAGSTEKN